MEVHTKQKDARCSIATAAGWIGLPGHSVHHRVVQESLLAREVAKFPLVSVRKK